MTSNRTVEEIASLVGGDVIGDGSVSISEIRGIEEATPGSLAFVSNPKYARFAGDTKASALIVDKSFSPARDDLSYILVDDPHKAFVQALREFHGDSAESLKGIHESAVIESDVQLGEDIYIGPNVVVRSGSSVGSGSVLLGNSFLGKNVRLGSRSRIYPNVSVYDGCVLGDQVVIHSGSVIGADGFGFSRNEDGSWEKVPQTGNVVVGDHVEIGACVTIDRGTVGTTHIGRGSKLDNHIHVAHNVKVGEHTVIAAQTGISGSTSIGHKNMIAGQVGIVGHIETVDNVIIEAQSGVSKSILKPGRYFGHPAKEHALALRQEGALRQLPELLPELREMKQKIRRLEQQLAQLDGEEE